MPEKATQPQIQQTISALAAQLEAFASAEMTAARAKLVEVEAWIKEHFAKAP